MTPNTRLAVGFAGVLLAGMLTGCGGNWKVVRTSGPPSALAAVNDLAVSFDYSQMEVEGRKETEWVALKTSEDANYPTTWADLKGRFEAAVLEGVQKEFPSSHPLAAGAGNGAMVVQVRTFKIGKFIPFVLPPTVIDAALIYLVGGQPTDEITLVRNHASSVYSPSVFKHIGPVGQAIGRAGGQYLASQQGK